ncbi:hypothetical protein AADW15_26260 [Saccharothrix sp. CCNWLY140-2]
MAIARTAVGFYTETFPIAASIFSEPNLPAAHNELLQQRNAGPHVPAEVLAGYLAREQAAGCPRTWTRAPPPTWFSARASSRLFSDSSPSARWTPKSS